MKKNLLLVLIIFSALNLFSQIEKGSICIGLDGNFMKVNTQNGVTTNQNYTKGQYLNIGLSAGYFITPGLVAGIGLDGNWNKETRYNSMYFNNFIQQEEMEIKSNVVLPNVYLGYYYQIVNKLYVSTTLKFSYGNIKTEYSTFYAGGGPILESAWTNPSNSTPYARGTSNSSEIKYFSAALSPEVSYFISSKLSICLNLGGITYAMNEWKTDNSNVILSLKPDYWRFGVKIRV